MKNKKITERKSQRILKILIISLFVMISSLFNINSGFAATKEGKGGVAFGGPTVNTFAAGMPLCEIYFDLDVFNNNPKSIVITDNNIGNALGVSGYDMTLLGSKLSHNTLTTNIVGKYAVTYENGAILPDGTKKDVVIQIELIKILTAKEGDTNNAVSIPAKITLFKSFRGSKKYLNFVIGWSGGTGKTGTYFAMAVEQLVTITIDGAGDFVVPFYGITQNRNNSNSYKCLHTIFSTNNVGYDATIETVRVNDSYVFYPENGLNYNVSINNEFIARGGTPDYYDPENESGGGTTGGDEAGYVAGFATIGSNGFKAYVNETTGSDSGANYQNNLYMPLGDLIHRICSGSGIGGSIYAYKNGTSGNKLEGGTFVGNIPSGFIDTNTSDQKLMRYTVPDAKEKVTYSMVPDKGYTLEKVVVDGTEYTVPDVPETSVTIANSDGDGVLRYLGGGEFSYEFTNANTQNHSIYVTWKKAMADMEVNKIWNDDTKASLAKVRLVSDAEISPIDDQKDIPLTSGLVYEWKNMPVYNYDSNGKATTAIKYTLSEISDPVNADYINALWDGDDKEGGVADKGFTLTDPSMANGVREINDPYIATVTNTLKKEVKITKTWEDQDNKYNKRPSDIAGLFKIYNASDDSEILGVTPTVTMIDENNCIITWSNLAKLDINGNPITYYVKEIIPNGYKSNPEDGIINENDIITNILVDIPKYVVPNTGVK